MRKPFQYLWHEYCRCKNGWQFYRAHTFMPWWQAAGKLWENRSLPYCSYPLPALRRFKTSDTIFLLGNGPSLNDLSAEEIALINRHDSMGITHSFLKTEIRHRYLLINWHLRHDDGQEHFEKVFGRYRESLKDVVIVTPDTFRWVMIHPRLTPNLFPPSAKVCYFDISHAITYNADRPFSDDDFEKSLIYRNSMSYAIDLAFRMGYKKIVLLGVDLDKMAYFYENHPEMREETMRYYRKYDKAAHMEKGPQRKFESMYPHAARPHPFDVYLKAVEGFLRRKKGAQLYVAHKSSILHPAIPAYFQ